MIVCLDPGHGGIGSDGVVYHGFAEDQYVLDLAYLIRSRLVCRSAVDSVCQTRYTDTYLRLSDRARVADKHRADLAISLHVNSHSEGSLSGLSCFVAPGYDASITAAQAIIDNRPPELVGNAKALVGTSPDDWTSRAHNVLKHYEMPAVLVECGFVQTDLDHLNNIDIKRHIANAIKAACDAVMEQLQ